MIPKQKSEWHEGTTVRRKNILNREKLEISFAPEISFGGNRTENGSLNHLPE